MRTMEKSGRAALVGRAIRQARKQRGKVMREVAEHLGVNVAAVGNWEGGQNLPSHDNLVRTAEFLGVDAVALGRGDVVFVGAQDQDPPGDAEFVSGGMRPYLGPMDVELMGIAVGGDDGDFSFNGEVAGLVRRPPGIAHLRNVFALHILSTSMEPRYDPGEMIYVGGREPVPGDHVVIEMFPENGERAGKSYVKKLLRRTEKEIIVSQYNPARELTFDRYAVKRVWRVIPWREVNGF
jgi:phage repressor protein C with HTH and peptisase S24 domain